MTSRRSIRLSWVIEKRRSYFDAGPMDAHAIGCPRVEGAEDSRVVELAQRRVAEAPFAHVLPVLIEFDHFAAGGNGSPLVVSVDDQAFVFGPGTSVVARLPESHGAGAAPIDDKRQEAAIGQYQWRRNLARQRRFANAVAHDRRVVHRC